MMQPAKPHPESSRSPQAAMQVPSHFKLLYSAEQIAAANARLGDEISQWSAEVWARSHTDLLVVPIMRGAVFFFADLVRQIQHSIELCPISASSYTGNQQQGKLSFNLGTVPFRGRSVLLVDDICDSGATLAGLKKALLDEAASEVRSAVVVRRKLPTESFQPEYVGFEFPGSEWLVGYGMDDSERWRNLSSLYTIGQAPQK